MKAEAKYSVPCGAIVKGIWSTPTRFPAGWEGKKGGRESREKKVEGRGETKMVR